MVDQIFNLFVFGDIYTYMIDVIAELSKRTNKRIPCFTIKFIVVFLLIGCFSVARTTNMIKTMN